ncbi:MAG: glycogen synthase [Bacteroidales bacterium]
MKVVHISPECYPVAKAGGLGDVVGSLPKYLTKSGIDTKVVMPFFNSEYAQDHSWQVDYKHSFIFGSLNGEAVIYKEVSGDLGFDLYVVEIPFLFPRNEVYGYFDDSDRYIAFQIVVLNWLTQWKDVPDIVHCHDHTTGLIPFLMKYGFDYWKLREIPSVFTIHNGEYQGQYGWDKESLLPIYNHWYRGMLDWDGDVNPMASAIKCSSAFTTVSEGYLQELIGSPDSIGRLVEWESEKAFGIINGIDESEWNPDSDIKLTHNYSPSSFEEGKSLVKQGICQEYGLDPNLPLISYIGRFAFEKGADVLPGAIEKILMEGHKVNFIIVGSGRHDISDRVVELKAKYDSNVGVYVGYNEVLARNLYAGSDFLLMPSRVEPCGLNQMYAMRYGTIPIVRLVGGLKDTVEDVGDGGEGFTFVNLNEEDVLHAVKRALRMYSDKEAMNNKIRDLMEKDFSWESSTLKYIALYKSLTGTLI